jgi:hypothetical protein
VIRRAPRIVEVRVDHELTAGAAPVDAVIVSLSTAAVIALGCAVACSSNGGDKKPPPADAAAVKKADAAPPLAEPEYDANAAGLNALLTDLLEARAAGNADLTYNLTESLRLRDYEQWFEERFGPKRGPELAADYKEKFDDIKLLADTLQSLRDNGRTKIDVERFEGPEDTSATGYQVAALRAMKPPEALYSVRLSEAGGKKSFHLWSFVHDGRSFRYAGKMKPIARPKITKVGDLLEYRVSDVAKIEASLAAEDK